MANLFTERTSVPFGLSASWAVEFISWNVCFCVCLIFLQGVGGVGFISVFAVPWILNGDFMSDNYEDDYDDDDDDNHNNSKHDHDRIEKEEDNHDINNHNKDNYNKGNNKNMIIVILLLLYTHFERLVVTQIEHKIN